MALVFFAVLVVLGLGALMFYIANIGHSFNVAASSIDDAAGDLGDYTAIVYEGTAEKKKAMGESGLDSIPQEGINRALELGTDQAIQNSSSDEVTASEAVPKSSADAQASEEEQAKTVTLSQARNSFLRKNASVLALDVVNPTTYLVPTIVNAGKYRFGILSIDEASALPYYISSRINAYEAADVDFIVAVVDDLSRVRNTEGIDIIVSTQEEGLNPVGVSSGGVFFNDAALTGEVGAILISPSKVISAKDISEL